MPCAARRRPGPAHHVTPVVAVVALDMLGGGVPEDAHGAGVERSGQRGRARRYPRRTLRMQRRAVLEQVGQRCSEYGDVAQEARRCQQPGSRAQGADPVLDTDGSGAV